MDDVSDNMGRSSNHEKSREMQLRIEELQNELDMSHSAITSLMAQLAEMTTRNNTNEAEISSLMVSLVERSHRVEELKDELKAKTAQHAKQIAELRRS